MPAPIIISDDQIRDLDHMIRNDRLRAKAERSDWERRVPEWRRMYEGVVKTKNTPWSHASNINLDLIGNEVDEFVSRSMSSLFGDQKWAPAAPVEGGDVGRWPVVEDWMQWALQTDMNAWGDFEAIMTELAIVGTVFVFLPWARELRTTREIRYLPAKLPLLGSKGPGIRPTDRRLIREVFGQRMKGAVKPRGSDHYRVRLIEDGREHFASVWVDRKPQDRAGEVSLEIEREVTIKDCPDIQLMEPTRVYTTDTGDLQSAPFVLLEQEVTIDWMRRQRAEGVYNLLTDEQWNQIVANQFGADDTDPERLRSAQTHQTIKKPGTSDGDESIREKDQETGVRTIGQASRTRKTFHCFYKYDINGDGFQEEVVIDYDWETKTVLGIEYLDRRYPHGRRPVILFRFRPVAGRTYAVGIPDTLANTLIMANTLINQAIDSQTLINNPWWFYDQGAGLGDRGEIQLTPGVGVPILGNPNERIMIATISAQPMDRLLPFVNQLVEFAGVRVGRASIQAGGNKTQGSGTAPPKTFGGTNMIMQAGLVRMEHIAKLAALGGQGEAGGFNGLFHQIYDLYSQLMPASKKFRIMGEDGVQELTINKDDLRIRPDFMFSVNLLNANPAVRQANALLLWQNVAPVLAQMGANDKWRNLLTNLYKAYEIKNPEEFTPDLPNMLKRAPMSQEEENQFLFQGRPMDVLPTDDDLQHVQVIDGTLEDMAAMGIQIHGDTLQEVQLHRFEHLQQYERKLEAMQTQAGNQGGRPMGGERRMPGQPRQPRPAGGGTF